MACHRRRQAAYQTRKLLGRLDREMKAMLADEPPLTREQRAADARQAARAAAHEAAEASALLMWDAERSTTHERS